MRVRSGWHDLPSGDSFRTPGLRDGEGQALLTASSKTQMEYFIQPVRMFPAVPCLTSLREGCGKEVGGEKGREKGLEFIMGDLLCVRHLK